MVFGEYLMFFICWNIFSLINKLQYLSLRLSQYQTFTFIFQLIQDNIIAISIEIFI